MTEWIQHQSWQQPDGTIKCSRCGVELPRILPGQTAIYIRDGCAISLGARPDAILCKEAK